MLSCSFAYYFIKALMSVFNIGVYIFCHKCCILKEQSTFVFAGWLLSWIICLKVISFPCLCDFTNIMWACVGACLEIKYISLLLYKWFFYREFCFLYKKVMWSIIILIEICKNSKNVRCFCKVCCINIRIWCIMYSLLSAKLSSIKEE